MPLPPSSPRGIKRYGLPANPYRRPPLDPLEEPADAALLDELTQLDDVKDYIADAAALGEAAFVMVTGRGGEGRTSVCNHLLAHYCDCRGLPRDRFVVPRKPLAGRGDHHIMRNWLALLYAQVKRRGLTPLSNGAITLDEELQSGAQLADPDTYQATASAWMEDVSAILAAKNAGFGVLLENVASYSIVQAALAIFEDAPTLVVMTVLEYADTERSVLRPFRDREPRGQAASGTHYPVVQLERMRGDLAGVLVQRHWERVSPAESPFDQDGLVEAFDDKPRPAGRVMKITAKALDWKVATTPPGDVWPKARELAFPRHELPGMVSEIDRMLPDRDRD